MAKTDSVVFEFPNPDGGKPILKSNDPYYNAKQVVTAAESNNDAELEALRAENAALKAAAPAKPADDEEDDDADKGSDDLAALKGPELKAKATELGVDITGLTKVGEVREAIRAHIAAQG